MHKPVEKVEPHPLDPLDEKEILAAVQALKDEKKMTDRTLLPVLALHEPAKKDVLTWKPGQPIRTRRSPSSWTARPFNPKLAEQQRQPPGWRQVYGEAWISHASPLSFQRQRETSILS